MTEEASSSIGYLPPPKKWTPEMILRSYFAHQDRISDLVIAARYKDGSAPTIHISSDTHAYFMSFVASVLHREAAAFVDKRK